MHLLSSVPTTLISRWGWFPVIKLNPGVPSQSALHQSYWRPLNRSVTHQWAFKKQQLCGKLDLSECYGLLPGWGQEGDACRASLWVTRWQHHCSSAHRPSSQGSLAVSASIFTFNMFLSEHFLASFPENKPTLSVFSFSCDLLERRDATRPARITPQGISLSFRPFEIVTLQLVLWFFFYCSVSTLWSSRIIGCWKMEMAWGYRNNT